MKKKFSFRLCNIRLRLGRQSFVNMYLNAPLTTVLINSKQLSLPGNGNIDDIQGMFPN